MGLYAQTAAQKQMESLDFKGLAPASSTAVSQSSNIAPADKEKEAEQEFLKVKDQRPEAGKMHNFGGYYYRPILKEIARAAIENGVAPETALAIAINESAQSLSTQSIHQGKKLRTYFESWMQDDGLHTDAMMMKPTTAYGTDSGKAYVKENERLRKASKDSNEAQTAFMQHSTVEFSGLLRRAPYEYIKEGYKKFPKNEALALQHYNGMGNIQPSSFPQERKTMGVQGKVRGADAPLYGTRVLSIREHVIKKNPSMMKLIDELKDEAESAGPRG